MAARGRPVTALVTGGTGFIGSHTAARLAACGLRVRLLVRDPARISAAPALSATTGLDVVVGDVTDLGAVRRALRDCTAVVHAAARVSLTDRDADGVYGTNVVGTGRVIGAAAASGIPAVYVSSVSVFATGSPRVTVDSSLASARNGYTRSKVAAERAVRNLQAGGAPIVIVYPAGVLGPDAPDVSATHRGLIEWLRTPPWTTSGTSIIDVRDVASAIARSLGRELPARWMLGGTFLSWSDLHAIIERITGVHRPRVPMPAAAMRLAGRMGDIVKRVIPFDYPLTYEAMVMATTGARYDDDLTRAALDIDWRTVEGTLADSIRWLAASGHIDARLAGTLAP
jgi:nucleoside-diphosphate-sugar epimerase